MTTPEKTNNIHGLLLNPKTVLDIENLKEKSAQDELGFSKKIDGFVNYVKEYLGENRSIVIGIYGEYGSGKSVFVNLVKENLKSSDKTAKFITFPAWKYKDDGSIWRNFILYISKVLQNEEEHKELNNSIYYTKEKTEFDKKAIGIDLFILLIADVLLLHFINIWSAGLTQSLFESVTLIVNLVAMIYTYHSTKRTKQPIAYIEEYEMNFKEIINKNKYDYEKIYIAIENIDRCLPDHSITLLESLRAFLDNNENEGNGIKKQLIFFIPCDKEIIKHTIENKYGGRNEVDASAYLDKLIQLPYDLPIPANKNYAAYVESLLNDAYKNTKVSLNEGKMEKRYFEYVIDMLKLTEIKNPREIKILFREWEMRFVNLDESIKYNKENWGLSINLESALFLLKLLILKKVNPGSYESHLELVSMTEDLIKDATNLSNINNNIFKRGGWDDVFKILNNYASGTIYEGKINARGNHLNEENNLMVYGNIKSRSFEDLQKFLLVTKSNKPLATRAPITYIYKSKE